jgi:hypothetical protein
LSNLISSSEFPMKNNRRKWFLYANIYPMLIARRWLMAVILRRTPRQWWHCSCDRTASTISRGLAGVAAASCSSNHWPPGFCFLQKNSTLFVWSITLLASWMINGLDYPSLQKMTQISFCSSQLTLRNCVLDAPRPFDITFVDNTQKGNTCRTTFFWFYWFMEHFLKEYACLCSFTLQGSYKLCSEGKRRAPR